MAYKINQDTCLGCGACVEACPVSCITENEDGKFVIDADACLDCGSCAASCPVEAPEAE